MLFTAKECSNRASLHLLTPPHQERIVPCSFWAKRPLLRNKAFKESTGYYESIALEHFQTLAAGYIVCYESWSTAPGFSHALVAIKTDIYFETTCHITYIGITFYSAQPWFHTKKKNVRKSTFYKTLFFWLKHVYVFSLCSDFMPSASRGETRVSYYCWQEYYIITTFTHTYLKYSHTNKWLLHTSAVKNRYL